MSRIPVALLALALALSSFATPLAAADEIRFMRDPHVGHGMVTFSYHGDIWVVDRDGTNARRLTNHVARETSPRISPDGLWIAFTSDRFGNDDVFVVPVAGGEPTQLTFHTGGDDVGGWSPDSRSVLFVTSRSAHPFFSPMYQVPLAGGLPTPLPMDQARNAMFSPDGRRIAFNRRGLSTTRKEYRGNNSTDIWVQEVGSGEITQLTDTDLEGFRDHVHDAIPMWGADGQLYFVSERSGIFNIWRIAPDGGEPVQVTRFDDGGVKYPSISHDGRTIVFTQEHELWTLEVPGGQPARLPVELDFDLTTNLVEWIEVEDDLDGFGASPDGEVVAVEQRGEIVLVPADPETGEKRRVTESPWRERHPSFSPDGGLLAYVSDESGEEQLWVWDVATGEARRLTDHASQKSGGYHWSPDGSRIAFEASNRLFEVDVASGRTTELGYNEAGGYALSGYSADGEWLVYDRRDPRQGQEVYLFDVDARREYDVTGAHPARDRNGLLTPDGTHVVFRSDRDDGTNHLFVVSLARIAEDPDDPLVRARRDDDADDDEEGDEREGGGSSVELQIAMDLDGIDRRPVQLTTGDESVGTFFLSRDGRTVFFTSSDDDGPGLFRIGLDGEGRDKVADGSFGGLTPTPDRRAAFYRQGGSNGGLRKMTLPQGRTSNIPFSFQIRVDHRSEWEQIFGEAWRVMKYRFYDENMHGKDWDAIRAEYEPLLPHVGTYEDLHDLANQMIGELNASHVGVSGRDSRPQESQYGTRYLGFEMEPAGGRYRVTHVYRDGPADKEWLDVQVGDYVLAVDGQELRAGDNYWRVLNHTLNDYVPVRVADAADGSGARELRIRTVGSLRSIQYEEWVQDNRDFVEAESDGRIAYVHIRSMNQSSLERFENEIDQYWDAQGIVVDIRYNGGGNIDQQLIDILERRPYEYWNSRWGAPTWGRRPRQAIAGPKVMLINNRSGSDSEVTPMGFRDLGLGRIVGNPTAAAVIATGSYGLIHGGSIRTPGSLVVTYDPEQPHNHGINLENYGVAPDVFVENTPADELAGFDRELKAAVDEALRMLREGTWQYVTPPDGSGGGGGGDSTDSGRRVPNE